MKDIHCHIIPGIDDGAKTLDESIGILKKAANDGITDICFTPHYIKGTIYNIKNQRKIELFHILKDEMLKNNININLYLGNELMICENASELIRCGEVYTINNSKYVLVEFMLDNYSSNYPDMIFDLTRNGYIPIIAHPERYSYFWRHPHLIDKYLDLGVIYQGNYKSLLGRYGRFAKKLLTNMLKSGKIKLLASDIHHLDSEYEIKKAYKKTLSIVKDENIVNDLFENNFDKIINNEDI